MYQLAQAIDLTIHQGSSGLWFITGGTGVGKTSLMPAILAALGKKVLLVTALTYPTSVMYNHMSNDFGGGYLDGQIAQVMGRKAVRGDPSSAIITYGTVGYLQVRAANGNLPEFLDGIDVLILDEVHEMTLATMLLLLQIKEQNLLAGHKIQLACMSATMDIPYLNRYLGGNGQITNLGVGTPYPITQQYAPENNTMHRVDLIMENMRMILAKDKAPGVLIFVGGKPEMKKVGVELINQFPALDGFVFALHGEMSKDEQEPLGKKQGCKVIIATDVVQSGVTINGINYVMDGGVTKEFSF